MKFYKFALWKAYFDKGYGVTSYIKWAAAIFGISSAIQGIHLIWIFIGATLYFIFCFIIGWIWYKYGLTDAENEVQNRFNPFQKEIRNSKIFK